LLRIANAIIKGIRNTENAFLFIGVAMLLAMMFLGAADVIGRYLFNNPIKGAMEGSQLLMAGVALLCWGYTQASKSHISIDLFIMRYPARLRAIVGIASLVLTIIVFGLIAWQSFLLALEAYEQHRMLENIPFPLFPFKFMVPIGAFILCIESVIQLVQRFDEIKMSGTRR
jgi:TRAP-type C4-dicarboxylate transport system permease small subunit